MGMAIGAHCSNEVFRSVRSGNYESKSWGMGLSNGIKNLASKDTNERIDWGSQLRPMSHGKKMMNAMQLIAYKFQSENRQKFRCNQVAVDMFKALLQIDALIAGENPNPHMQSAVVAACMAQNDTDNKNTVLHYIARGSNARYVRQISEMVIYVCGDGVLLLANEDGQIPLDVATGQARAELQEIYENSKTASVRAAASEVALEQEWQRADKEVAPARPKYSVDVSNVSDTNTGMASFDKMWDAPSNVRQKEPQPRFSK